MLNVEVTIKTPTGKLGMSIRYESLTVLTPAIARDALGQSFPGSTSATVIGTGSTGIRRVYKVSAKSIRKLGEENLLTGQQS